MSNRKIPDRWIPYKPCGNVIEGTRIICFKVPLHKKVQKGVPGINKIWDIPTLLAEVPKLGAVIDLTNTARYYNPSDFMAANVLHRKMLMPGREIPPESKVREFMDTVDEFLGKSCDSLVGVHCTHGLNRTGYMVCRYMRDRLDIPAKEAIKRFENARGYKIERANYIANLLGKSVPKPDIGKETIIKKIDNEVDSVEIKDEGGLNSGVNNQDTFESWRDRHSNSRVRGNGYSRVGNNEYLSWRNRDQSGNSRNSRKPYESSWRNKNRSKNKDKDYDRPYSYIYDY